MPHGLPERIASLEDLDPRVQQFYDRDESGAYVLTDISGLKNAKNREREDKKRYKDEADKYKQMLGGLSESEFQELSKLREKQKEDEVRGLEERRAWEALRQQLEANHKKLMDNVVKERDEYYSLLEEYVRNDHIQQHLAERGATETGKKILPKLLSNRVKVKIGEDRRPGLEFLDETGSNVLNVNSRNEPYTISDFMDEVSGNYQDLFSYGNKSGTGAAINAKNYARQNMLPSKMNTEQKAKFVSEQGLESFLQLMKIEKMNSEKNSQ